MCLNKGFVHIAHFCESVCAVVSKENFVLSSVYSVH